MRPDGAQLASCISTCTYNLAVFIPCTERPSTTARQSRQMGASKTIPARILRQRLQTGSTLGSKQNSCCNSFGCLLLNANHCTRLFNLILWSTTQRATMSSKPIARRSIPCPLGTCPEDRWCPHALQAALAADGNGAPAVRATPIVAGKWAKAKSCFRIPLGLRYCSDSKRRSSCFGARCQSTSRMVCDVPVWLAVKVLSQSTRKCSNKGWRPVQGYWVPSGAPSLRSGGHIAWRGSE